VTIVGGTEMLQTQTTMIGTTLTERWITDIPTFPRDASTSSWPCRARPCRRREPRRSMVYRKTR